MQLIKVFFLQISDLNTDSAKSSIVYLGIFIFSLMMSTLQASGQARCDVFEYIRN